MPAIIRDRVAVSTVSAMRRYPLHLILGDVLTLVRFLSRPVRLHIEYVNGAHDSPEARLTMPTKTQTIGDGKTIEILGMPPYLGQIIRNRQSSEFDTDVA